MKKLKVKCPKCGQVIGKIEYNPDLFLEKGCAVVESAALALHQIHSKQCVARPRKENRGGENC